MLLGLKPELFALPVQCAGRASTEVQSSGTELCSRLRFPASYRHFAGLNRRTHHEIEGFFPTTIGETRWYHHWVNPQLPIAVNKGEQVRGMKK